MIRRALVAVALASIATVVNVAQNPYRLKPGATGQVCLECHVAFEETMNLPSVHTPVAGGECSGCHNPHASSHGKLLAAIPQQVCLECHDGFTSEVTRSAHEMVVSGECVSCHDPHATSHENNLHRGGNELCQGCHTEIARGLSQARFTHAPVEQGCVTCHDPHASEDSEFLLREGVPGLCKGCHDTQRATFSEQHMGYPVDRANCTSCHDPHGSSSPGMLWATVHKPIVNKMCDQCHVGASAADALQTKQQGAELCRGCHNSMLNDTQAKARLHWPLADGVGCQHCHSPHASKQAALLPDEPARVCGECHADTIARGERSLTKHQPLQDGECTVCHSPHGSDSAFLLAGENTIEVCGTCHDWEEHSSHPLGENVLDKRNANLTLECSSCHRAHGSEHKYFAPFDPASALCVNCHEEFRR